MLSSITAIVIDDDKNTAKVFADYLDLVGVKILSIGHDGKAAVDLYKQHRPDLVFLDVIMPNYDGVFALTQLEKQIQDITPEQDP